MVKETPQVIRDQDSVVVSIPHTLEDGDILRKWIIKRILDEEDEDVTRVFNPIMGVTRSTDNMRDCQTELLRALIREELETAYTELLHPPPGWLYPTTDEMISQIHSNTSSSYIQQYFYTDAQIWEQFEDHLNTLDATKLLDIFEEVVLW